MISCFLLPGFSCPSACRSQWAAVPLSWLSFHSFPPGRRQSARGKLTSQGLSGSSASEDVLSISNNQVFHIEVQVNKSTERAHFTRPKNATLIIDQKKATLAKNFAFMPNQFPVAGRLAPASFHMHASHHPTEVCTVALQAQPGHTPQGPVLWQGNLSVWCSRLERRRRSHRWGWGSPSAEQIRLNCIWHHGGVLRKYKRAKRVGGFQMSCKADGLSDSPVWCFYLFLFCPSNSSKYRSSWARLGEEGHSSACPSMPDVFWAPERSTLQDLVCI